ncbi:MAG: hypothetical protein JW951_09515, partial [Lentisphaerae bacterium]|nr:hypothetical protein [Lentisphaerota bacterium]
QQHVLPFLREHGSTIALVGALAVILFLALTLLVLWVRARGKFMFLDNVLNNRAEIRHPWHVFAQHGNSLFRWTVGYAVICLLIGILLAAATFVSAVKPCIAAGAFTTAALPGLVVSIVLWIVFGIITAYIGRFLEDFIVPLMYKHDLTTREAWARFLPVFRHNAGAFVIYGLFYLVLSMIAGFCVLLLIIATCCIAACIVGIPYLGTVLLLPIPVFFRLYSLEYLAQYGRGCTLEPEG